jgi:hypothetical protein
VREEGGGGGGERGRPKVDFVGVLWRRLYDAYIMLYRGRPKVEFVGVFVVAHTDEVIHEVISANVLGPPNAWPVSVCADVYVNVCTCVCVFVCIHVCV